MAGNAVNPKENVLYVVLHGLISLVDIGDAGFIAYMFDIGTDHRYLFGTWLIENDIPERNEAQGQGPLILTLDSVLGGVLDPPNNVLDPDLNLVIQLAAPLPLNLSGARAVIRLPRPRRIYHYTCGQVAKDSIQGDLSKLINSGVPPTIISATRVFEYTFADSQKPQLVAGDPPTGDPLWKSDTLAPVGNNRQVATLHFYDEPGKEIPDQNAAEQHARAEFLLSTTILGVPLRLTKASQGSTPEPLPPHKPQPQIETLGIREEEVTPLDGRSGALLDLQFLARSRPMQERPDDGSGGGGGPICGGGNAQVVLLSDSSKSRGTQKT